MDSISFAGDGLAPELVPAEELADCAATALEEDGARILSYGTGAGYTPLRELIAERFGVHPFRVFVTNGWLQGFALLVKDRVRGKNVMVEFPTYDPAIQLLFKENANLLYLDRNASGLAVDQIEVHFRTAQSAALAYLMPTFHNPSGLTISEDQRYDLGRQLHRRGVLTLEDDSYSLLRFEGEDTPSLFELSAQTFAYSSSFSYTIAPGLRVAFFIFPDDLASEIATIANSIYITPALASQATVFEFMRRGSFEPNVERLRAELLVRRDAMVAALERHMPSASWVRPEGGIFLWLHVPPSVRASELPWSGGGRHGPTG